MSNDFGLSHIKQLTEIQDTRKRRGQRGIGSEVEELISRLTSGGVAGKTDDVRTAQAKRLWDIRVGRELGFSSFDAYLATIPEIHEMIGMVDADYPLLVLVEPRLGLKRLCGLGNIDFSGDDRTFVEYDERHCEFEEPTWIRVQDGRNNRNRSVRDCRKSFAKRELGLTALQGVCAFILHPEVVTDTDRADGHVLDLSGSIRRGNRDGAACLRMWRGRAELVWVFGDHASPECGSASRRERKAL